MAYKPATLRSLDVCLDSRGPFIDASIVVWATDHAPAGDPHTNVWCMRRPGRTRCRGEIMAELRADSEEITWLCPWCGENGVIRGWEHTLWDRRRPPESE